MWPSAIWRIIILYIFLQLFSARTQEDTEREGSHARELVGLATEGTEIEEGEEKEVGGERPGKRRHNSLIGC